MTTRTWDGSNNGFSSAADWSPAGLPQAGDTAVINAGTVGVTASLLDGLIIQLEASSSSNSNLILNGSTISANTKLQAAATSGIASIGVTGRVVNDGLITFSGPTQATFTTTLSNASDGTVGLLENAGSIAAINSSPNFVATAVGQQIENDGSISVWNASHGIQFALVGPALTGIGAIMVDAYGQIELNGSVGSGQTIQFLNNGSGNSAVQIDSPSAFAGTITGFANSDTITLRNASYTAYSYAETSASGGTLTLTNNGANVAQLNLDGSYQTNSFNLAFTDLGFGLSTTQITTIQAAGPQIFHVTDAALNLSTTDAGVAYTGPVSYLQNQFIWSSPDAVAISAGAPNVFLKGGSGGDALEVSSGQNVLDGGGGSNFLVGGTGTGSQDTFFVDGRGGVNTWSTIVNFHEGDQATIFGFKSGVSTLPYTASDGAAGYTGLTIHSELNGAGTGVNESITFTGIDRATADAHFSITSGTLAAGTASATDYLLIQYNH